ncbi:hypothetical protein P7K49_025076 [Saguinus oedipus]|uniref:Uncharacterized protein n=1 Tax=Saguinus oedipus TaxID=9490 RepID=A0ABQ9UG23_SAGOE|nr:hypothetical protein P7K49_025076 [Saguinus oedipus]
MWNEAEFCVLTPFEFSSTEKSTPYHGPLPSTDAQFHDPPPLITTFPHPQPQLPAPTFPPSHNPSHLRAPAVELALDVNTELQCGCLVAQLVKRIIFQQTNEHFIFTKSDMPSALAPHPQSVWEKAWQAIQWETQARIASAMEFPKAMQRAGWQPGLKPSSIGSCLRRLCLRLCRGLQHCAE